MILGGTGGANTNKTGLKFEKNTSLETALQQAGYEVIDREVLKNGEAVGKLLDKNRLYAFLEFNDVDWRKLVSAKLLPDEAVLAIKAKSLTVVEKKWQETPGSVDEKLQTSGFKIRQYRKLLSPLGVSVKFVYLLNDWFSHPRYQDVLDYIKESGADYHFNSLPLDLLELD